MHRALRWSILGLSAGGAPVVQNLPSAVREILAKRRLGYTMLGQSPSTNQRGDFSLMFCDNKHRFLQNKVRSTRNKHQTTRNRHRTARNKRRCNRTAYAVLLSTLTLMLMVCGPGARAQAQAQDITSKLSGFDSYMEQVLKDWNTPGIGVGIVVNDKLVFAKGYGYRVYEKKLPFTPTTLWQIASNSKLFTAVSAGMLVEEGKLTWDKPVRESVPTIQFYNDQLNNNVTLRDMLSHRTGIRKDVGAVCAGQDLRAAQHEFDHLYDLRDGEASGPRSAVQRKARYVRAVQDPLLRGHRRRRPGWRDYLEYRGHVTLAHRLDE